MSWLRITRRALALLIVLTACGALRAQTRPATADLGRAEELFQRSELVESEKKFLAALPNSGGADRRLCYSRLLSIYYRLGRHDRALAVGEDYRAWLAEAGDEAGRREVLHQLATCHLVLGHYPKAVDQFREVLRERPALPLLPPRIRIEALSYLAQVAEKRHQADQARQFWLDAEACALKVLANPPEGWTWEESVICNRKLADCYRFLDRPAEAVARLEPLLKGHESRKDVAGLCETLRMLAGYRAAGRDFAGAEADLRRAVALTDTLNDPDPVRKGDLLQDLAGLLKKPEQQKDAVNCRANAARLYGEALRAGRGANPEHQPPEAAFWKLQTLYQQALMYKEALQLAEDQFDRWAGESLAGSRLRAEQGILNIYLSYYKEAREALVKAVEDLRRQSPANLIELPRTLNSLAVVEQARGDLDAAERWAGQALALYRDNALPDDPVVVETHGILGTCAALRGRYHVAVRHFHDGVAGCEKAGKAADRQHSNLLLNLALVHKSQGDLDEALRTCRLAQEVYLRYGRKETSEYACFLCALASLEAARGHFDDAGKVAGQLAEICKGDKVTKGPLVLTAQHCLALERLARKDFVGASDIWLAALAVQETTGDSLRPRTLNYLGLTAELRDDFAGAEKWYAEALALQTNGRSYPVTLFVTLWRTAGLLARRGNRAGARAHLERAVKLVEERRLETYGDAQQRVTYFAQFAPAFDALVDLSVRDGRAEDALKYSARGRSRGLLDQILAAGVDPLASLTDPDQKARLSAREAGLREKISKIRLDAQLLPPTAGSAPQVRSLMDELEKAQANYSQVRLEILDASDVYRLLAPRDHDEANILEDLRTHVVRRGTVLLVYHLGAEHSYLMLLSDRSPKPEVLPLTVPVSLLEALARKREPGDAPVRVEGGAGTVQPLTRESAALLVRHHLRQILPPALLARGARVVPREAPPPSPDDFLVDIAEALLPAKVRKRVREIASQQVVIVPDGALHKVPLESLVLRTGSSPLYALDELPPTVYAPSVSTLALLARRPPLPATNTPSLLSVCDPAYPEIGPAGPVHFALQALGAQALGAGGPPVGPLARNLAALALVVPAAEGSDHRRNHSVLLTAGMLKRLPHTAEESECVSRHFAEERVKVLKGGEATEAAVRDHLAGRRVVHFAVHGLVDEPSHNLFGALAFTPPAGAAEARPENDGFLSLHEIYGLPLGQCDLAVLSACDTNVGPLPPLEAGVTLANGFLTAGARHVLASHWAAHDQSTANLMSAFFDEARPAGREGASVPYSLALYKARKKLRNQPQWSDPVYWAPFVLIGTGEGAGPGASRNAADDSVKGGPDEASPALCTDKNRESGPGSNEWIFFALGGSVIGLGAVGAAIRMLNKRGHRVR